MTAALPHDGAGAIVERNRICLRCDGVGYERRDLSRGPCVGCPDCKGTGIVGVDRIPRQARAWGRNAGLSADLENAEDCA